MATVIGKFKGYTNTLLKLLDGKIQIKGDDHQIINTKKAEMNKNWLLSACLEGNFKAVKYLIEEKKMDFKFSASNDENILF